MRPLALLVAALLGLGAATAAALYPSPVPVQPVMPVNPAYSYSDWEAIMEAQELRPEQCDGCKEGTVAQPAEAGRARVPDARIIGGAEAAAGQFPWQVQVRMDNSYFCGGSLISAEWILSAGHCASGFSSFVIVLGTLYSTSSQADPNRLTVSTREAYVHNDYNSWLISDDISVLKLPTQIDHFSDFIRPIRLPSQSQTDQTFAGEPAVLSGWGRYGTSSVSPSISPVLRFVSLAIIPNQECAQSFGSAIRSTNVCTSGGTKGPIGACNGDSGGPLTVKDKDGAITQVGIVSFGTSLGCNKKYPSAYTRVTSYLKWISDKTGLAIRQ